MSFPEHPLRLEPSRRPSTAIHRGARTLLVACLSVAGAACQTPLDTTRTSAFTGTLGEEIHYTFCRRFAASAYPNDVSGTLTSALCRGLEQPDQATDVHLAALVEERGRLAPALDATMPVSTHADLDQLLLDLLPLYDDGTLPGTTRALADVLDSLRTNPTSLQAIARFSQREGYRPSSLGLGVVGPVLRYPDLTDVTRHAFAALGARGVAEAPFAETLRAGALELATLAPSDPTDAPSNVALLRDLLFREDDLFASGTERWTVARDARGLALPTGVDGTSVPGPFVDRDGDHLPDVDSLGRYVDANGARLELPAPFAIARESGVARDAFGRAQSGGALLYAYRDLDRTMASGLLREVAPWLDPSNGTLVDLARGLPVVMGAATTQTRTYGATTLSYPGFDSASGPLYDLLHAGASVMHRAELVDALALTETLLRDHESIAADLVETGLYADARADVHPEAILPQPNVFWDELLAVVERMSSASNDATMEAVLRAMATPEAQDLDPLIARFMTYRDAISFDPANVNAWVPAGPLTQPVNRAATDADPTNESLLERSLYLISDLTGTKLCNKAGAIVNVQVGSLTLPPYGPYAECALFEIDDVAKAYAQAVLGRFKFVFKDPALASLVEADPVLGDTMLQLNTGIQGMSRYPTPQAMARLVFAPRNKFLRDILNDPLTGDGVPVEDRHCLGRAPGDRTTPCANAVIFAWEKPIDFGDGHKRSFLDALAPVMRALDDTEPVTSFYFGEIGRALHRHYPSRAATRTQRTAPTSPGFSYQDDIRSYEPLVAEIFGKGLLVHRLAAVVTAADGVTVPSGDDGVTALARAAQLFADPDRSTGLSYRDGRDHVCFNDGTCFDGTNGRSLRRPSPLYLLLDALHGVDDAWASEPDRHTSYLSARSNLVDQFFSTEADGGARRFANRRGLAILRVTLPFLRARIEAHRGMGEDVARAWAIDREHSITGTLSGPLSAAGIRLLDAIDRDPDARDALLGLLRHLLDESSHPDAFSATLFGLADALAVLDDDANVLPLVHTLSGALAPNVNECVGHGGVVDESDGVAARAVELLRRTSDLDTNGVLVRVLANAAGAPSDPGRMTRLETILDVIAEVNRMQPESHGPLEGADVLAIVSQVLAFLTDQERSLERLYAVVGGRQIEE